ncbi:DUF4412 domain-containing protein [Fluviicola sp.]|uniref:DUF4412 domain-containing protein n=1 Tax=Fluviicola sp. TaxID=1917219 RepID=UPI0031E39564
MKALLLFAAICYSVTGAYGQELLKSIGNTAKEKANAQDFNTTRNNKERGNLQQEKNRSLKESESAPAPAPGAGAAQPESPVEPSGDYQASYTFSSSVTYRIESPKKANETQEIHYSFGNQVIKMEAANQDMSSIIDSKNGVMILLNNKDKTATVMSTKMMEMAMKQQAMNQNQGSEKPAAKVTKTGRTKTILGYKCEEIIIESDKKTEAWVTSEAGIDVSNIFANMAKTPMSQVPSEAFSGGVLMEMTSYDAEGKAEMHMLMTALSKETKIINIGSYKITKL